MHLEKYFDETYKREYYYNPETKESIWELPEDVEVEITDCVQQQVEVAKGKLDEKKSAQSEESEDPVD